METSLIGKALNFGFNECEFESRVSNIYSYSLNYTLNQININLKKRNLKFYIRNTQKNFNFFESF